MADDIQITRTGDEPGTATLTVEAPVARVAQAEKKAAQQYAKRIRIPGFRKGKVPLHIVQRRFGDAIREAVVHELINESWKQAVDQESLEPISEPQVRSLKFDPGSPITFELYVAVRPHLNLDRLSGFTLERKVSPVTDDQVDDQLDELRRQRAPWVPVEQQPKPGHLVRVSIVTGDDEEGAEPKSYDIVLGQNQALPEVEERILQLRPGESGETTITLGGGGEDGNERRVEATITLHEVKEQQLPEVDDDFAKAVGDFETAADLRGAVRSDLEASASREADAEVRRQLLEQITVANGVPAPQPLVDRLLSNYREAYGIPDEQSEKFASEFTPIAEAQVRRELILDHVAQAHDLKATEDDVDERVESIAEKRGEAPGKVYAALQKDQRLQELERSITEEKVFAFLLEQSTVTES